MDRETAPEGCYNTAIRFLVMYEQRYQMSSADFGGCYQQGKMADRIGCVGWSGDYRHYVQLKERERAVGRADIPRGVVALGHTNQPPFISV